MRANQISLGFILSPEFTLSAFSNFLDAFRLASDDGDASRQIRFRWDVISPNGQFIRSSTGIEVLPTAKLSKDVHYDYLIVVGGVLRGHLVLDEEVRQFINYHCQKNTKVVALCTGTFLLAKEGLLNHKNVSVNWFHINHFKHEFPLVNASCEELYIQDRNIFSCAGGVGVAQLAAHLIAKHYGNEVAEKSLRIMMDDVKTGEKNKQPYPVLVHRVTNPYVKAAMSIIEKNLKDPLPIDAIAKRINLSTRQLERLFLAETNISPTAYAIKARLNLALKYLLNTDYAVGHIANETGFISSSHFSKVFRKEYKLSATAMRKQVVKRD
ncbi:GlxA family transcriptional regulator [Leeia sp. TBRC 13508]|uniref:GlxA family transcriptional regulator n=1 Tax=Leeia speluncae TaxID=2884804 RepID=A0ABS8DA82_9NEIS|nr:GlxA family transcriptional regulator [Leeia speluncae]MCB6185116.1 GlxA family transcriptional regulator [Leeia speluncae]